MQHANNPVDWYPWGNEAFEKARKEDKPIFLSIGYSTCHWCHVMEKESFEDSEVAKLMNDTFISIKVDREERPDIDKIYMIVCQTMTGGGGWPLTIIMTQDKKPFFAATYIPKKGRFGQVGMLELIPRIKEYWVEKRDELLNSANKITMALEKMPKETQVEELGKATLERAYKELESRFDEKDGGFSSAPKFPTPHNLFFLLRYWKRTNNINALQMVEKTLESMRLGGIFDQIGFGFHRYSTDDFWLVPHFEKMLYDQALLTIAYAEAYQATKKNEYRKTVRKILSYILRDMTSPTGGFFSAEDADSKNKEGKMVEGQFYLWKLEEIEQILNKEEQNLIIRVFNIKKGGNFLEQATGEKNCQNILHLKKTITDIASELKISEEELQKKVNKIRVKLFNNRLERPPPQKDDKILTDWNGIMIAALAKAARILNEQKYIEIAENAIHFILNELRRSDGRLLHRYRDGQADILANLDDYAFLIWGCLEMYETTFDTNYLQFALDLNNDLLEYFWDVDYGGFYFTPNDGEELLFRQKEIYDGATPSGNSIIMLNLLRLGRITGNIDFEEKANCIGSAFSNKINERPSAYTQLMVALDFAIGPTYEVVIAGNSQAKDTKEMISALEGHFIPNKIVILNPTEQKPPEIFHFAKFIKHQSSINGKATAYVCSNYACKSPTNKPERMLELLDIKKI